MARTAVTLSSLAESTFTTTPTMTGFAAADGASVDVGGNTEGVLLRFAYTSSASAAAALTIQSGANPPAFRAGIGDLVLETSGSNASAIYKDLVIEDSARYVQSDGKIYIDSDTNVSGSLCAIRLPK
jgi:hypothetical protein